MERISIGVPRVRAFAGDDALELLSDYGTGTIDLNTPVTDQPQRAWSGLPKFAGHLFGGHLGAIHLDSIAPDGHLDGLHLDADHLYPAALIALRSSPLYFGAIQFAVRVRDRAGNAGGVSAVLTRVANGAPRIAGDLRASAFVPKTGLLTFAFRPSPDL